MSRFDLYRGQGYSDYLLDVQSNFVDFLDSRLVIPIVTQVKMQDVNPRLHVCVMIDDQPHHTVTNLMGAVRGNSLGRPVGSLAAYEYDITAAIDFLLQGF